MSFLTVAILSTCLLKMAAKWFVYLLAGVSRLFLCVLYEAATLFWLAILNMWEQVQIIVLNKYGIV